MPLSKEVAKGEPELLAHQAQHCARLSPWQYQPVDCGEFFCPAHQEGIGTELGELLAVRVEIALEGKDSDSSHLTSRAPEAVAQGRAG